MKQNQMKRRPRPRPNGRKNMHSRGGRDGGHNNRLDPKMRNHARQMLDKYKSLARDAMQSNDRVQVEYYLQHAEHYQRVLNEFEEAYRERQERFAAQESDMDDAEMGDEDGADEGADEDGVDGSDDEDEASDAASAPEVEAEIEAEAEVEQAPRKRGRKPGPRRKKADGDDDGDGIGNRADDAA